MNRHMLIVLFGAASYGMLASCAKIAYGQGYIAAEITFVQAAIGAFVLWCGAIFLRFRSRNFSSMMNWPLVLGGMGMGAAVYTYYLSIQYIPASLAIVLHMQMTWISIILEWLIYRKKPTSLQFLVILLILAGTVLAGNLLNSPPSGYSAIGIGYALLSAVMYSVYVIATSRVGSNVPVFEKSALMMSGSAAMILMINANTLIHGSHYDWGLLGWGIFLAIFGTIIPPVMFARSMTRIGAGTSSILLTMELPVAIFASHILLGESITMPRVAGILLMLGSIIMLNLFGKTQCRKEKGIPVISEERA